MSVCFDWREAPRADFAVMGDPVEHSLSPRMHTAAYEALGLSFYYVAIHCHQGELSQALARLSELGYRGVNLTIPLKEEGAEWARRPDDFVSRVGSANTLNLLDGSATNTDAPGFLDTLQELNVHPPAQVLMLGAGGSARALSVALEDAGYKLRIHNRTKERAEAMKRELGLKAVIAREPNPADAALILNATSASLHGEAPRVLWDVAERRAIAYDLAYGSELTPFLLQAGLRGLKVVDGREMLVRQGARCFEWWLGRDAPVDAMRRAVA